MQPGTWIQGLILGWHGRPVSPKGRDVGSLAAKALHVDLAQLRTI